MSKSDMAMTKTAITDTEMRLPTPSISMKPISLPAPDRGEDIQVRVSAPATGLELPIIVFSHGYGSSMNGYEPLVDFWSSHGFVVIQPTHLDSRTLQIGSEDARTPDIWKIRIQDIKRTLDHLDLIEASVPGLSGRLDKSRIAVAGHSWGGQTVSTLLGAQVIGSDGSIVDLSDSRVKAGVLLATPGQGGADLTPFAAEHFPFMNPSFTAMTTPTLVIAGDHDQSALSVRGPDWFADPYRLSPSGKFLLTLFGAEHSLGGISGLDAAETTDANPDRVAAIQKLTWAYLRSALYSADSSWVMAQTTFNESVNPLGRIEGK